jgi:hypothetical protein
MTSIHIHAPKGYYIGQTRPLGGKRWNTVTSKCHSSERAMSSAVLKMREDDKRARVLFITYDGWYEPTLVMECAR